MVRLNLKQAKEIVDYFGEYEETIVIVSKASEGHSGAGLYVHIEDYPEEGSICIGDADCICPTDHEGKLIILSDCPVPHLLRGN